MECTQDNCLALSVHYVVIVCRIVPWGIIKVNQLELFLHIDHWRNIMASVGQHLWLSVLWIKPGAHSKISVGLISW